jgi:hypothetical protein
MGSTVSETGIHQQKDNVNGNEIKIWAEEPLSRRWNLCFGIWTLRFGQKLG